MQKPDNILRVLVVDDHPIVREALCAAIDDEPDMAVTGQAADGLDAVAQSRKCMPDVVVMDLFLPEQGGVEAIAQIKAEQPQVQILALTSSGDEALVLAAIQAGATGYLVKDTRRNDLLAAVRAVGCGDAYFAPKVASKLTDRLRNPNGGPNEPLTDREREILRRVGQGATNREIADQLGLGESTVRTHLFHALKKLNLENRNQAVVYAVRTGLV